MNRLDKKLYSWVKYEIYFIKCKFFVGYDYDKNVNLLCGFFYLKKFIFIEYIYIYIGIIKFILYIWGSGCIVYRINVD